MPVRITCRNLEITPELHDLIEKKAQKLKKFFTKVDRIDVILTAEKHRRKCEINVHAAPFDCTAECENGEEGSAFDKALKSAIRQIKESKDRMIVRKHNSTNPSKTSNRSGRFTPASIEEEQPAV